MSINDRNYLLSQNRKKRDKHEHAPGKRRTYYDRSCPICGLPGNEVGNVMNKFSSNRPSKKAKCRKCGILLAG